MRIILDKGLGRFESYRTVYQKQASTLSIGHDLRAAMRAAGGLGALYEASPAIAQAYGIVARPLITSLSSDPPGTTRLLRCFEAVVSTPRLLPPIVAVMCLTGPDEVVIFAVIRWDEWSKPEHKEDLALALQYAAAGVVRVRPWLGI